MVVHECFAHRVRRSSRLQEKLVLQAQPRQRNNQKTQATQKQTSKAINQAKWKYKNKHGTPTTAQFPITTTVTITTTLITTLITSQQ